MLLRAIEHSITVIEIYSGVSFMRVRQRPLGSGTSPISGGRITQGPTPLSNCVLSLAGISQLAMEHSSVGDLVGDLVSDEAVSVMIWWMTRRGTTHHLLYTNQTTGTPFYA